MGSVQSGVCFDLTALGCVNLPKCVRPRSSECSRASPSVAVTSLPPRTFKVKSPAKIQSQMSVTPPSCPRRLRPQVVHVVRPTENSTGDLSSFPWDGHSKSNLPPKFKVKCRLRRQGRHFPGPTATTATCARTPAPQEVRSIRPHSYRHTHAECECPARRDSKRKSWRLHTSPRGSAHCPAITHGSRAAAGATTCHRASSCPPS